MMSQQIYDLKLINFQDKGYEELNLPQFNMPIGHIERSTFSSILKKSVNVK
jgi:aminopeptidase-like protein